MNIRDLRYYNSISSILPGGFRYSYVLNNPLKYTDPSGYVYRYKRIEENMEYHQGAQDYAAMMSVINDAMDRNTPGGGGGGPDGWYKIYRSLKRKGINITPAEVLKQYNDQMNSHTYDGTLRIKRTIYTDWFKITKDKSGKETSREYMYSTSRDIFYDYDISHAFSPDEGAQFGSIEDFYRANKGKSYDEIINQQGVGVEGQPMGPSIRFVEDPLNPGKYIDMRHMLIIGKNFGSGLGIGLEIAQWFGPWFGVDSRNSAFSIQDIYSNNLGECFFTNYGNIPGGSFTDKLIHYMYNHTSYDSIID